MQEIRYKLIWMGQQLGPYTKAEIDQLLAKNEIGRSHIVELPTGCLLYTSPSPRD